MIRIFYIQLFFFIAFSLTITAQDKVSPYYFGPNAFPVPDMPQGNASSKIQLSLFGDYALGFAKDRTITPSFKITVPLFSDMVSISGWWYTHEFYSLTPSRAARMPLADPSALSGSCDGDIYIATNIHVLKQKQGGLAPNIVLRAGLKTASGGQYHQARYYDSPGYFFDASLSKSLFFDGPVFTELLFTGSFGFLCWQVDNGRQNDAYLYGLGADLMGRYVSASFAWGGYTGWIKNGDAPQTIKASLTGHIGPFGPFFRYEYGLRDYPFHVFRIGVTYNICLERLNK